MLYKDSGVDIKANESISSIKNIIEILLAHTQVYFIKEILLEYNDQY